MKNSPLLLTVVCTVLLSTPLFAQNDSTRLDAGNIVLNRAFAQHIAIKGEDLEKMPFTNLADAINVWINGAYTMTGYLIYVVDGNIVSDVSIYSIHDIAEVVFLQDARALTNTATTQQDIVLITTRKYKDKLNIRGAAQTFVVHRPKATTNLYHQYYAGADVNYDKFSAGVSVNYLRDVMPKQKYDSRHITDPGHLDRWRLNGSLAWRPDTKNTVELHVGYAPQSLDSSYDYLPTGTPPLTYTLREHEPGHEWNVWTRWRGDWAPGLRNDLQAGYLQVTQKGNFDYRGKYVDSTAGFSEYVHSNFHTHQFFVRDRLSYTVHSGGWTFEPSFNASYNYISEGYLQTLFYQSGDLNGGGLGGVNTTTSSMGTPDGHATLFVLTPALDITYNDALNIQGGITSNVSDKPKYGSTSLPGTSAFGSIGIDLLRLDGVRRSNSLRLFGSYAQRSVYYSNDYTLNDVDGANPTFRYGFTTNVQPLIFSGGGPSSTIPIVILSADLPKYWVWEAGAKWSALQNRFAIDYNIQRRNFSVVNTENSGGTTYISLSQARTTQHRLGLSYRILDKGDINWLSGINVTRLTTKVEPMIGGSYPWKDKPAYTGGWVNRVQYHRFSLGLDLLYHFGDVTQSNGYFYVVQKNDFRVLQNVYLGYKLTLPKNKDLELYVDSRQLAGNADANSLLVKQRKYYGVGGKIAF